MSAISYNTFERNFRREKTLGKGNCSTVTQVYHLVEQRSYALKLTELDTLDEMTQSFNEVEAVKGIDDDRLAKIYYYFAHTVKGSNKIEFGIIMELCGANLSQIIKQRRRKNDYFRPAQLRQFIGNMIGFFAKMQEKGYMHRDIKPDNILLARSNRVEYRVADFGFAIKMNVYSTLNVAGTLEYVSPKLKVKFKNNKVTVPGHTFKDDVYSLGKTLFEVMCLEVCPSITSKKTQECQVRYGSEFTTLISMMTCENQLSRPDFLYLKAHIEKTATPDPIKQLPLSISTVEKRTESVDSKFVDRSRKSAVGASRERPVEDKTVEKFNDRRIGQFDSRVDAKDSRNQQNTRTKRKDMETNCTNNTDRDCTQLESLRILHSDVKEFKKKELERSKQLIKLTESAWSVASCDDLVFVGLQGKLAIIVATNRTIRLTTPTPKKAQHISIIRVDKSRDSLMFIAAEGQMYLLTIMDVKKLIVEKNQQLRKNADLELPLTTINHRIIKLGQPVRCFDCFMRPDSKEPSYLFGHYTGDITYLANADSEPKTNPGLMDGVTCLSFKENALYLSSESGVFKKITGLEWPILTDHLADPLGLLLKQRRKSSHSNQQTFYLRSDKHDKEGILSFQILLGCERNKGKTKADQLYLAALATTKGYLHVISCQFTCEYTLRLTNSPLVAVLFQPKPTPMGFTAIFADQQGVIVSQTGLVIQRTNSTSISSLAVQNGTLAVGHMDNLVCVYVAREVEVL